MLLSVLSSNLGFVFCFLFTFIIDTVFYSHCTIVLLAVNTGIDMQQHDRINLGLNQKLLVINLVSGIS